ncbi:MULTISPECIES: 4-hydroxy-tetrahydrodipicolinate synthase [Paraburkholderia]|uniref:4-hydroxy-tetrahydrodipicolinate synthase n=1 Tax=Paraburkholderia megapolitana TaxID=420953 RepID=A0A1I3DNE2_9BURK|nr:MULTISPECIES: 4-hydroxy-tetrahydrodipicolinate synthase [Paraburkholderia]MCX4161527.1 4-hydroxy-tetrahydrodipicolinate synthase [Paraburkholderia megapolitana]MDN7157023.1 4-hydroxy-tetrahydrodipicolinate synthase [Paraburkholderia sp. CHISQ3]MDQ6494068.1 4-hydroxy-tetrahydrodipicolinate synthase [Paraburkholderia megapolitana]QDQ79682.1 4-hydroxy-tetrahydrodipicolinate synthase [Paraburkholderia megapolitana]SFH88245.1 4-hydroxy-tetrahydrodipicolinate synthase [Paraburkholderia megapolita
MLSAQQLQGVLPAIPTPVHADDTIDADAARALIHYLLKQGVDGIVPLGGTGEYGALARTERVRMAELTARECAGKVPVIAGVLDPGYHDALQAGREFAAAGADALLVLTPYYTNPTQQGIRDYYMRYADEAPAPILIYEIPYRTRIAITPEVLHELSQHERIIGMKACNTDMWHFLRTVAGVDASFSVLSGEDTLFPLHVAAGARGGIVVTASLLPTAWRTMYRLAVGGNTQDALALHRTLIPLMNMAFAETNPGPIKSVMDLIGVHAPAMLAPLVQAAPALSANLRTELERQLNAFERRF